MEKSERYGKRGEGSNVEVTNEIDGSQFEK